MASLGITSTVVFSCVRILNYQKKIPINYVIQLHFTIPLFPLSTKINLFLNSRSDELLKAEFGDVSREQLLRYLNRNPILHKILPGINVAKGIIELADELKDSLLGSVNRMVMSTLVLTKTRYKKLEKTGNLPDLIYIDDFQRSLMSSKWTVLAYPCERPASIPKISLITARKQYPAMSIGNLTHYDTSTMVDGRPNVGKIGEFELAEQFDDDVIEIVIDGLLMYDRLQIRSPYGVTHHIERRSTQYSSGPQKLRVVQIDTPDENLLYQENNDWGNYWEGEILPTLSPQQRVKALSMRAKSDLVGGEEESDSNDGGTLPVTNNPRDWNKVQVANFIRNLATTKEYQTYAQLFEDNAVDGLLLNDIDNEMLLELGVNNKLHRFMILNKTKQKLDEYPDE